MKKYVIILSLCLFILGCESDALPLGVTSLTLRVIEKDKIFIVQRYDRLFLIGTWDNECKFRNKKDAEDYKNEWLENYRRFKNKETIIY